jgi:hypothetical protein
VRPAVPVALQKLSLTLLTEIGPAVAVDYLQRNAGIAGMMLQVAAVEWDRAAARRVEENAALRALFRDAAAALPGAPLRARLADAAAGSDADLRIASLDAANRALRALLTELHAELEASDGPEARHLEAAVWTELRRSTERRAVPLAPL